MRRYAWARAALLNPPLVTSVVVPATRVGDAAHRILCEGGGDCTEAEEGSERKCERAFHDPTPLVQKITMGNGRIARVTSLRSCEVLQKEQTPTNCDKM